MIDHIKDLLEQIKTLNSNIKHFSEAVGKVWYYTTHPLELVLILWNEAVKYSFYVCLMIFVIGTIVYLIGYKKGAKWAMVSIFSYVAIQIFNLACR